MMRRILYAVCAACILVGTAAYSAAPVVLKGGTVAAVGTTQVAFLTAWSDLVKERTNGQVIIEVYPAEQLGNERSLLEATNLGTIDWGHMGGGGAERLTPEFGMFENAFALKSVDHLARSFFNREFVEYMSRLLEAKSNMKFMGFQWVGHRHIIGGKPLLTPEDGRGVKIRVPDVPAYRIACEALGAVATPVALGEVYMGLSQGVVDAADSVLENIYKMKWHEVKKVITLTSHIEGVTMTFMNKRSFERKLTSEQQEIVFAAGLEVYAKFFENYQQTEARMYENLKAEGVEFFTPSKEQMAVFVERAQKVMTDENLIEIWGESWEKFQGYAE